MECKDVEAVLEQDGLSPLPLEARDHLADCEACRDLLADLSAIVVAAKRIPAEENPPERVWVSLRAQLQAEGIIREPQVAVEAVAAPWWEGFARLLRPRALAMVSAGILAMAGGLYFSTKHTKTNGPTVARTAAPAVTQSAQPSSVEKTAPAPLPPAAPMLSADNVVKKPAGRTVTAEANKPSQIRESTTKLRPSPSELASYGESAAVLDQTERAMPSAAGNAAVAAALSENLRTLNEFIAECKARLKENPGDQLTQEYLNMALQQKAELLGAMMDSRRSEH
jgi:hypothetical protein